VICDCQDRPYLNTMVALFPSEMFVIMKSPMAKEQTIQSASNDLSGLLLNNSSEYAPAVRVCFRGILVALAGINGVIVYSTPEGDALLGSPYSTRGMQLGMFLKSNPDVACFESFLSSAWDIRDGYCPPFCSVETRTGALLRMQLNVLIIQVKPEINPKRSSCRPSRQLSDDFSFNDTFE